MKVRKRRSPPHTKPPLNRQPILWHTAPNAGTHEIYKAQTRYLRTQLFRPSHLPFGEFCSQLFRNPLDHSLSDCGCCSTRFLLLDVIASLCLLPFGDRGGRPRPRENFWSSPTWPNRKPQSFLNKLSCRGGWGVPLPQLYWPFNFPFFLFRNVAMYILPTSYGSSAIAIRSKCCNQRSSEHETFSSSGEDGGCQREVKTLVIVSVFSFFEGVRTNAAEPAAAVFASELGFAPR